MATRPRERNEGRASSLHGHREVVAALTLRWESTQSLRSSTHDEGPRGAGPAALPRPACARIVGYFSSSAFFSERGAPHDEHEVASWGLELPQYSQVHRATLASASALALRLASSAAFTLAGSLPM